MKTLNKLFFVMLTFLSPLLPAAKAWAQSAPLLDLVCVPSKLTDKGYTIEAYRSAPSSYRVRITELDAMHGDRVVLTGELNLNSVRRGNACERILSSEGAGKTFLRLRANAVDSIESINGTPVLTSEKSDLSLLTCRFSAEAEKALPSCL